MGESHEQAERGTLEGRGRFTTVGCKSALCSERWLATKLETSIRRHSRAFQT